MNKKLLTAAIAAVIAAPAAALANDVTVYGAVHVSVDYLNEFDSSWRGEVFVQDPNTVFGTAPAAGVWVPAIRTDAGTIPGNAAFRPSEAVVVDGNTWVAAPTVANLAAYQNFLASLQGDRNDGFDVASRATRLGFKGTEDLANGLKAIWKMEFQIDVADRGGDCAVNRDIINSIGSPTLNQGNVNGNCDSGQLVTARNAYVGLAGGWGTFLVGRHDTPFKMSTGKLDLFADTLADYNSTIGFVDIRTNSAIAYVSPSWSGLSFAGALVAPHVYSANNSANYTDSSGNAYLVRKSADADSLAEAYSLALTYDNAGFFASVAYENISGTWFDAWTGGGALNSLFPGLSVSYNNPNLIYNSDDSSKWRVGLGWTGAGFTVGGLYEWEDNVLGINGADGERWQISAGYTFGNNMIKAMYGQGDFNLTQGVVGSENFGNVNGAYTGRYAENAEQDAWAIGFDHNLSKRTKAYILYTAVSGDSKSSLDASEVYRDQTGQLATFQTGWKQKLDVDRGGFSIGMIHTF